MPDYQSLQASGYDRESVRRDQPGWFADGDGIVRAMGERSTWEGGIPP
jgi:hypothetical protein